MTIQFSDLKNCYVRGETPVSEIIDGHERSLMKSKDKDRDINDLDMLLLALNATKQAKTWTRAVGNVFKDRFVKRETVGSLEERIRTIIIQHCSDRAPAPLPPKLGERVRDMARSAIRPVDRVLHSATAAVVSRLETAAEREERARQEREKLL